MSVIEKSGCFPTAEENSKVGKDEREEEIRNNSTLSALTSL